MKQSTGRENMQPGVGTHQNLSSLHGDGHWEAATEHPFAPEGLRKNVVQLRIGTIEPLVVNTTPEPLATHTNQLPQRTTHKAKPSLKS